MPASVRITVSSASLRGGPGTEYSVIGYVLAEEEVQVIGRSTDGELWYNVISADGVPGWIAASVGQVSGETSPEQIPPAATIPAPPPTVEPTPAELPTGTPDDGGDDGGHGGEERRPTPTPPF
jgi:uncharacterized protein YraI